MYADNVSKEADNIHHHIFLINSKAAEENSGGETCRAPQTSSAENPSYHAGAGSGLP